MSTCTCIYYNYTYRTQYNYDSILPFNIPGYKIERTCIALFVKIQCI